jgi:hypothetical protein
MWPQSLHQSPMLKSYQDFMCPRAFSTPALSFAAHAFALRTWLHEANKWTSTDWIGGFNWIYCAALRVVGMHYTVARDFAIAVANLHFQASSLRHLADCNTLYLPVIVHAVSHTPWLVSDYATTTTCFRDWSPYTVERNCAFLGCHMRIVPETCHNVCNISGRLIVHSKHTYLTQKLANQVPWVWASFMKFASRSRRHTPACMRRNVSDISPFIE